MRNMHRLALMLAVVMTASCAPVQPTPAPSPDPGTSARLTALEDRTAQLLQQLGRLEERLAILAIGASPSLAPIAAPQSPPQPALRPGASKADGSGSPPAPASGAQLGPRGGCYVITSGGKKRYVSRDRCG